MKSEMKSNQNLMIVTHRLCGIICLRVIPPLVVDQHLDQLVVHDLHVNLQQLDSSYSHPHDGQ